MSVSWYVDYPCSVRERYSSEQLAQMEASRNRARMATEALRNGPFANSGLPEEDWTFTMNDNSGSRTLRIGDLLEESKPLDDLKHHCISCTANIRHASFGCGGGLRYPISAAAEAWLMSCLPSDLSSSKGTLALQAVEDFASDVRDIDGSRQSGVFFEAASPTVKASGSFFRSKTISSSQVIKLLLFVGSLSHVHARMMAYFLGYLDDKFAATERARGKRPRNSDQSTADIHYFLQGCALAGERGTTLYVDA